MSDTDTINNVADPTPDIEISSEELRNVRVRRFAQQPIRYRQSIGDQVLNNGALANSKLADASDANSESDIQSSIFDYGDEEANKFLQDVDHSIVSGKSSDNESNPCNCQSREIIVNSSKTFQELEKHSRSVLVHRNPSKFWEVLFRQNINFSGSDISIIWAGEQDADGRGLYKEFLLHSMENFLFLTNLVFGRSQSLLFTAIPGAVMHKKYHTLEQLSALAILTIGRGPSCLNTLLVHTLFEVPDYSLMLLEGDLDGELGHYLKRIEEG